MGSQESRNTLLYHIPIILIKLIFSLCFCNLFLIYLNFFLIFFFKVNLIYVVCVHCCMVNQLFRRVRSKFWKERSKLSSNFKGQGTIEYLVIIAVVVVLALVVVGLVIGVFNSPSQQVSSSSNNLGLSSQVIGITESLIDPEDGNFVVRLLNNSGDVITVSNVSVGDNDVHFSEDLYQGSSKFFTVDTSVVCEEGKIVSQDVIVTYVTRDGLVKAEKYPAKVMFDCTPFVIEQANLANQCPVCETCADSGFGLIEFDTPNYSAGETGTVVDSANGLVWQASSYGGTLNWQNAVNYCATLDLGGYSLGSWRLPNIAEVGLLYNYTTWAMYGSPFTNNRSFWSSTTMASNTGLAYYLNLSGGFNTGGKTDAFNVGARCVRSAS